MGLLERAIHELVEADEGYTTAEGYYKGTTPEFFSSWRLQYLLAGTGTKYRCNFAATPVDVLLERCVIESLAHPTADIALQQIWDDNELEFESIDLHRMSFEFGDSYAIVWPDESLASGSAIYGHDPRNVRLFYDKQRPRVKSHAIQLWEDEDTETYRVNLYLPDTVERYVSQENEKSGLALYQMTWTLDEVVDNVIPGVVPVFHFRNGRPYGTPEHEPAFGPQEMINKLLITMMASVDYAGFPQRYVLTDSSLDPSPENDFGPLPLPLPEGSLLYPDRYETPVDEASRFEAGPGSTWLLGGANLKVGQFATADSDNFLKPLTSLVQMMASVTDVPMHYFSITGGIPSGESYRAANAPLNKKAEQRQDALGATWSSLLDYCLELRGVPSGAEVLWRPVDSVSGKEFWESQVIKQGLGVPVEELLAEGGYSRAAVAEFPPPPEPAAAPEAAPSGPVLDATQMTALAASMMDGAGPFDQTVPATS